MKKLILIILGGLTAVVMFYVGLLAFRVIKIDFSKERLSFIWSGDIREAKDGR